MTLWGILRAQNFVCSDDLFARLTAERLNGGRVRRNTIILRHSKGTFKATAEGNNIVWKYGTQEIHGNTCNFTVAEDNSQIICEFDSVLTRFISNYDKYNQSSLSAFGGTVASISLEGCKNITGDLADLKGSITGSLNLSECNNITGDLADLKGRTTTGLGLDGCKNITGDLADLQAKITNYLGLYNCVNITGDLADLGAKITRYLGLTGCKNITGNLSDLGGKIMGTLGLGSCKNITGVYSGASYPTTVNLSNTGLTAADMDQTLINFNAGTTKSGTFTAKGMTRTAASDAAVAGLTAKGWTVSGLTKIEG